MAPPRFEESGRVLPPQHSESQERVLACRPHRVRIARFRWPPREKKPNEDKATLAVACLKCGATVLAEANPVPKYLEVVLYGPTEDPAGTVISEGVVLETEPEPERPRGGTVSEEPESPSPPRRDGARSRA